MNLFVKDLPPDTQILIAIGAAVAAGCQPCIKRLVGLAGDEAIETPKLRAAATIGQFIKDQPIREMKALTDSLLGNDPATPAGEAGCPLEASKTAEAGCRC